MNNKGFRDFSENILYRRNYTTGKENASGIVPNGVGGYLFL
jgi:hypothetical protein